MVKDDSDRLSGLRQELRSRLGDQRFELWLGAPTELALEGEKLAVRCASEAETRWLRRRLPAMLSQCCEAAWGAAPRIVFKTAPVETTPIAQSPAAPKAPQRELFTAAPVGRTATEPTEDAAPVPATARKTFADFVTGVCNTEAAHAARTAAMEPGRFSPLVLYGPAGSGKSHLLSGAALQARAGGRARTLHLTAEQFTSQFLAALYGRTMPSFRSKMRSVDHFLLDDVQFIAKKKATIEELLYTIDEVQGRGGQIVLASDRAPASLQAVSPELVARISAGLCVALEPPDYATRKGILRAMAHRMRIPLSEEVIELAAQRVAGSARMLSGAINRLVAASMSLQKEITVELANRAIDDFCQQHLPAVRLGDIQRAVCEVFGVESASLKSAKKTRAVAEPRMLAMWLARRYTRAPLSEIGDFFGRRSHSTVVSAQRKFDGLMRRRESIVVAGQACAVDEAIRRIEAVMRTA